MRQRSLDQFVVALLSTLSILGAQLAAGIEVRVEAEAGVLAGAAGRTIVVEATCDPADLHIVPVESYALPRLEGAIFPPTSPGHPWLPAQSVSVLIPAGTEVTIGWVEVEEQLVAQGITIYPAQPEVPLGTPLASFCAPDPAAYAVPNRIPAQLAEVTGQYALRGYRFATVRLNPVRYAPADGELYLATRLRVTLETLPSFATVVSSPRNDEVFKRMVRRLTVNGEMLDAFTEFRPVVGQTVSELTGVDYLIVTSSALASEFQTLANHRATRNGLATEVLTTEAIYANPAYAGRDNQERIRNCILDYVRNRGTACVVLGGDNTVVPVRGCYIALGGYEESAMPTDLYYAGLDSNWDEDGDGIFGEADTAAGEEGDLAPEVVVGRIPVRTVDQARAYIAKLTSFENSGTAILWQKLVMCGLKLWDTYTQDNRPSDVLYDGYLQFREHQPVSDAEMWTRRLYRDGIQPWWNTPILAYFFDTLTAWDSASAGDYLLNAVNLSTRFKEGWGQVFFATHGGTGSWALESGSYGTSSAGALSGLTAFIYTIACSTGGFDAGEPSLSEAFLRNGSGGSLAYFGCSRYGWGSPDSPPASNYSRGGTSMEYAYQYYEQLLSSGEISLGVIFSLHKAAMSGWSRTSTTYRWVQLGLNYQGDPGIQISEVVSPPTQITGSDVTIVGKEEAYTASGAMSSLGHSLEYRFHWGDGVISPWGPATQTHAWSQRGVFPVKAQARCAAHGIESSWSTITEWVAVNHCQIVGHVRDTGGSGIAGVRLTGLPTEPQTDASGSYTGLVSYGWNGAVTPVKAGYVFSPASRSYA
ncbi:MAG: C25 family cysteine peptidase, partial [Kiritimatiellia bacterium]